MGLYSKEGGVDMEYLQNYLSVLPEYDRQQVEQLIQSNMDLLDVKAITKEEFEALLQQLANQTEKVTQSAIN